MARILILYGSTEGHTTKIVHHMAALARDWGHGVETIDGKTIPPKVDLDAFDAVIIGAPVHRGTHPRHIKQFVRAHRAQLERVPSAFFSVSLSSSSSREKDQRGAEQCVATFVTETGWTPEKVGKFAGALRYTQYGPIKRWLMKRIVQGAGGDSDTSRDYDYTDWAAVTRFTEAFLASLN